MAHLIDKDAITDRVQTQLSRLEGSKDNFDKGAYAAYNDILRHINTLEVKEVDLEKEMDKYFDEHDEEFCRGEYLDFAKHFFELGLKAQKGEEVDLDKEIDLVEDKYHGFESLSRLDVIEIIKYFFELGLKENRYKT